MNRREAARLYRSGEEPTVAKLLEYDEKINRLDDEIQNLKNRIAQLEKNSNNSSCPPSSDKPEDKAARLAEKRKKSGRNPGGQPGHKGCKRNLVPIEEVDKVIHLYPRRCEACSRFLPQDGTGQEVGNPHRWQVTEIPPLKPFITEYQSHTTECTCGHRSTASLPPEVATSNFGPRLAAIVAYLTAVCHVPRRGIQEFFDTLLNINISVGSVQNLLGSTSCALEETDEKLRAALADEPVVNADETGWRDRWLWVFVASTFIYFSVAKTRASKALIDVFGNLYQGILCVDRWGAYSKYHKGPFQLCWAHLKRDIVGILKTGQTLGSEEAIVFAWRMQELRKRLMAMWYQFKGGTLSRAELIKKTRRIRDGTKECLKEYENSEEKCVKCLARNLLKRFDHLFTFIFHERVEPTNNSAERGIRPAVQWRKICFGNRSDKGAVITSRLLTVTRTCWLQKRNPLEFLVDAIAAYRTDKEAPSLLMEADENNSPTIASCHMR
jgi:transposase